MSGKYRNVRTTIDGRTFDSRGEANRYLVLKARLEAGEISDLELQPSYRLAVNGETICHYRADFRYVRDGETIVEDFKSTATMKLPQFRMKAKLMRALHGIELHITTKPDAP